MEVLVAWSKVVAFRVLGSGRAPIVARLIVGVRGTVATGVELLGTSMGVAWSKGFFGVGLGKGVGVPGIQGQEVGAGMSGVRLVGALGRDQTYVSAGNPTHRRGNGRRGNGREGPVLGAGVGAGGNRVGFQEVPEDTCRAGGVGVEAAGAAPKGQGKTQRDLILEAVEALKALLGQGVGTQVVDLIQEHIPPPPQVAPPSSPSESERAQHLAKLLEDKVKLDKVFRRGWRG